MNLIDKSQNLQDLQQKSEESLAKFYENFDFGAVQKNAKECKSCRSRRMLQKDYFVAIVAVHAAENEPSKVSPKWGVPSGSFRGHDEDFEDATASQTVTAVQTATDFHEP